LTRGALRSITVANSTVLLSYRTEGTYLVCAVVEITGLASGAVVSHIEPRHAFCTCGSSSVTIYAIVEVST